MGEHVEETEGCKRKHMRAQSPFFYDLVNGISRGLLLNLLQHMTGLTISAFLQRIQQKEVIISQKNYLELATYLDVFLQLRSM